VGIVENHRFSAIRTRGRPNFVFVFVYCAENGDFFIFRHFIFRPKKTCALFVLFYFSALNWCFWP